MLVVLIWVLMFAAALGLLMWCAVSREQEEERERQRQLREYVKKHGGQIYRS